MPYPDSEYPSRGRDKRESQRLLDAAHELVSALRACADRWDKYDEDDAPRLGRMIRAAIAQSEGRE